MLAARHGGATALLCFLGSYQFFGSSCQGGLAELQDVGLNGAQPEEVQCGFGDIESSEPIFLGNRFYF